MTLTQACGKNPRDYTGVCRQSLVSGRPSKEESVYQNASAQPKTWVLCVIHLFSKWHHPKSKSLAAVSLNGENGSFSRGKACLPLSSPGALAGGTEAPPKSNP